MDKKFIAVKFIPQSLPRELDAHIGIATTNGRLCDGVGRRDRLDAYESRSGLTARPALVREAREGWWYAACIREDVIDEQSITHSLLCEETEFVLFGLNGHGALGRLERYCLTSPKQLRAAVGEWDEWRHGSATWLPSFEDSDLGHFARRLSLRRAKPGGHYLLSEVIARSLSVEKHGSNWTAYGRDERRWIGESGDGYAPSVWTEVEIRRTSADDEGAGVETVVDPLLYGEDEFVEVDEV